MDDRALTILLVDDDEVDVMTVKRAFHKANITNQVHVASNGVEALEMLRSDALPASRRLILLDLNMPRMNGIEFLRELRGDPKLSGLTVVVLTTSNEDRDRVDAYRLNVAGYLLKPVTFHTFADVMATLNKYWPLWDMPYRRARAARLHAAVARVGQRRRRGRGDDRERALRVGRHPGEQDIAQVRPAVAEHDVGDELEPRAADDRGELDRGVALLAERRDAGLERRRGGLAAGAVGRGGRLAAHPRRGGLGLGGQAHRVGGRGRGHPRDLGVGGGVDPRGLGLTARDRDLGLGVLLVDPHVLLA